MPKRKLLKDFFKKAYKNRSKKNKDTLITRKEVKKKPEDATLKKYCHIL